MLHRTTEALRARGGFSAPPRDADGGVRPCDGLAREAEGEGADLVIARGRGTTNEVANGLALSKVPLGYPAAWAGERSGDGNRAGVGIAPRGVWRMHSPADRMGTTGRGSAPRYLT